MKKYLTILLVLLNIVVFATLYLIPPASDTGKYLDNKVFNEEAVGINRIRISGPGLEQARVIEKEGKNWLLREPIRWPANFFAVSRILNQIQFLEKETSFSASKASASGADLASYGLENPKITLEFRNDQGQTTRIKIGAATEIGNRAYILSPDETEILVVKRELIDSLLVDLSGLRSQTIFDLPLFQATTLAIQKTQPVSLRIRINLINEDWRFETPIQTEGDTAKIESLINGLNALKVQEFIASDDGNLAQYGLQTPFMRVTLEGENKRQTILIGNQLESATGDALYYAKMSENPTIFTIPSLLFNILDNAQVSLRARRFVNFDPDSVSSIEISQGDTALSLQRLEVGEWQIFRREEDNGRMTAHPADGKIIHGMMDKLLQLRALSFVTDAPSAADLENFGLTDPQRVIQVRTPDTSVKLIVGDLAPGSSNSIQAYAKLESEPYIYTINQAFLEHFPAFPLHYRNRTVHQQPADARLVSITVRDLDSDTIVYTAALNEVTPNWTQVAQANEADKRSRDHLLKLVDLAGTIEARDYLVDSFMPQIQFGNRKITWKYTLDLQFALSGPAGETTWTTTLWLSDRLGGTRALAGSEEFKVIFLQTQDFVESFYGLTFNRFDPGPEPEPTPEELEALRAEDELPHPPPEIERPE